MKTKYLRPDIKVVILSNELLDFDTATSDTGDPRYDGAAKAVNGSDDFDTDMHTETYSVWSDEEEKD